MSTDLTGTWIRTTPTVALIRMTAATQGGYTATIDHPAALRFRAPIPVAGARVPPGHDTDVVEAAGDRTVLAGRDGTRTPLHRLLPPPSAEFTPWCGWYEGGGRTLLLTQFPEAYFGDPMYLIQEGDAVTHAYPLGPRRLVHADGDEIHLEPEGGGRLVLRPGGTGRLVLRRTDRYRESAIDFAAGGLELSGTLIAPAGAGPHPAAVFLHGAAGGQRDYGRLFAGPLLAAGVAVLIYDKQGHGRSAGQADPTIFDQADAACAALDVLAHTPGIDPGRLGLLGFSNGMWSGPMAAARRPGLAFLAGVGSPGVTMADSEVHRRTKVLREAGVGEAALTAVAGTWHCLFGMAASGEAPADVTARLAGLLAELSSAPDLGRYQVPEFVRNNPMLSPVPPLLPVADLVAMVTGEPDAELYHDPEADYRRLRCPVFLQYGADDTSVPVGASAERIGAALRTAGDPRSAIRVYPGLEHLLNARPAGLAGLGAEEATSMFCGFRFGPGVRADLTGWLRQTVGT